MTSHIWDRITLFVSDSDQGLWWCPAYFDVCIQPSASSRIQYSIDWLYIDMLPWRYLEAQEVSIFGKENTNLVTEKVSIYRNVTVEIIRVIGRGFVQKLWIFTFLHEVSLMENLSVIRFLFSSKVSIVHVNNKFIRKCLGIFLKEFFT